MHHSIWFWAKLHQNEKMHKVVFSNNQRTQIIHMVPFYPLSRLRFKHNNLNNKFEIDVMDNENNITVINCDHLINAAGIFASDVANTIDGLDKKYVPNTYLAKGNYFSLNKKLPISHLIYPVPEKISLGIHPTLEIDHSIKFGPDAEWVDDPYDYSVDENLKSKFLNSINKYLPDITKDMLSPAYAGLRPITSKEDRVKRDFTISTVENHQIENLINLYGIESPGLTSSLAIAKYVTERV